MPKNDLDRFYQKLSKKESLLTIIVIAVALFGFFGWLWWQKVYANPKRVFWGMLSSSLQTPAVTRQVTQNDPRQGSLDQVMGVEVGSQNVSHTTTTLVQPGVDGNSTVKSEDVGTPTADYVRYLLIDTKQKNAQGKPLNFSKLLNIWGKSDQASTAQTGPQFFKEGLFGLVPITSLNPADQQTVLKFMRDNNVYDVDYNSAKHISQNGRPMIQYDVKISAQPYVEMLQKMGGLMGLGPLAELDPASYVGVAPIELQMSVDVLSHQLVKVQYTGSNRVEAYSGHGMVQPLALPSKTISITELQNRLQSIH